MKPPADSILLESAGPSATARKVFALEHPRPMLLCRWTDALFIHYRLDPRKLQPAVPFELVTHQGQAYVSLVAFTMDKFRLGLCPRLGAPVTMPVTRYAFLNVRTYVRHAGQDGIYFLVEYVSNRIAAILAPRTFGLPYRLAKLELAHNATGKIHGCVASPDAGVRLVYNASFDPDADATPAPAESFREFVMERYTAFTDQRKLRRRFRIWHDPWPAVNAEVQMLDTSLLSLTGGWFPHAEPAGAHYTPGVNHVSIGPPVCVEGPGCQVTWNEDP